MDSTGSAIKYIPLNDKVVLNEQDNSVKYNSTQGDDVRDDLQDQIIPYRVMTTNPDEIDETRSKSFKFKNENKLFNILPDIKFTGRQSNNNIVKMKKNRSGEATAAAGVATTSSANNNNNNDTLDSSEFTETVYRQSARRSTLEKFFLTIIIVLSIITISLIVLLMYKSALINRLNTYISSQQKINGIVTSTPTTTRATNNTTKFCLTDKCIVLSGNMYNKMDVNVDPCDDFYEYACGNFLKHALIPRGYPRWSTIVARTYANQLVLKDELERAYTQNDTLTNAELKAVQFYKSCVDIDGYIEKLKAKPLLDIVNRFMYKEEKSQKLVFNDTFKNLLYLTHVDYGLSSYFQLNVMDDDKNSSFNDMEISQGTIALDRSYYLNMTIEKNKKVVDTLVTTIKSILVLLHGDIANLDTIVANFIKFETRLAEIMIPYEKLSNIESNYNRVSLKNLTENLVPFIDWFNFTNTLLSRFGSAEKMKNDDTIVVLGPEYFQNLTLLLNEYNSTDEKRFTLMFSMYIHLLKFTLPLISSEYRAQLNVLNEALTGASLNERWQQCIDHVDSTTTLGFASGRMFVRKKFNQAKTSAIDMIKRIRKSFTANLPHVSWMDEETRHLAEDKIQAVSELIGFPDFILSDVELNKKYQDLSIDETDYFGNEVKLNAFAIKNEILSYRKRVQLDEWDMTPATVNAYYVPTRNQIVFPAGILQEPFFNIDYPQSMNFGGIGTIMGHELSHGFDDSGREYDKNGMLHQWWNDPTIEAYNNASSCIVDQYSTYKINDENLNGKRTLGENIADNGALKTSYNAYLKWVEENGEEPLLPVLNLTHRQLFFLSFAQAWCTKATSDSIHLMLSVDPHSPPRFRVIGSVSNSKEFAENFKCKAGSKMNPIKKCSIF